MAEVWPILKAILEVGAVGAVAVLMFWVWNRKDKEIKEYMDKLIQSEKDHTKAILKEKTDNNREMSELVRNYDTALTTVNATLEKMVSQGE